MEEAERLPMPPFCETVGEGVAEGIGALVLEIEGVMEREGVEVWVGFCEELKEAEGVVDSDAPSVGRAVREALLDGKGVGCDV